MEHLPWPDIPPEVWCWLCAQEPVREDRVAAARARLQAGTCPPPLAIADALLAGLVPV